MTPVVEAGSEGGVSSDDYARLQSELLGRWPENAIEPSLTRMTAVMDLLGGPQRSYPVIQVAGTNGKSSTARMIASLLRSLGLRTGLYTSPHLVDMRERIEIDGEVIGAEEFLAVAGDIAPFVAAVDAKAESAGGTPITFFEMMTAIALAAFADAPVDVAVIEVGLGGSWDATSVVEPQVSVITRIDMDHTEMLGDTLDLIAQEKAGIIKPGCFAVIAEQDPVASSVLATRIAEVGVPAAWEGTSFAVTDRAIAVGGQLLTLQGMSGVYTGVFLPLFGAHQADNAALALAAVEAFIGGGGQSLDAEAVEQGFADVASPGRLEVVRRGPTVLIDAAHNPAGARALAAALAEAFAFTHIIGVVAVLADKDARGLLESLEPVLDQIIVTENSSPRCLPVADLEAVAVHVFGAERVQVAPRLEEAVDLGVAMAEEADTYAASGVIITGSVVTAGEARSLLVRDRP